MESGADTSMLKSVNAPKKVCHFSGITMASPDVNQGECTYQIKAHGPEALLQLRTKPKPSHSVLF